VCSSGWVSVHVSKAVDHGFIGGIMVSVLVSKAVDRGFIDGIMDASTLITTPTVYPLRDKDANHYATDEPTI
jgi:hypothetical protein